jgi:hypothetical protein
MVQPGQAESLLHMFSWKNNSMNINNYFPIKQEDAAATKKLIAC